MARKTEPGITYYPVKTNHTQNSKIRLLFNEFDADGYWIWSCLLCRIYEDKGYYFDLTDDDELELFATDVCKKKVSLVNEVVAGCVRRGLFNKSVFDKFSILTSERIQLNYVEATAERRRKTTVVTFFHEYLLITPEESWKNIKISHLNGITPRNNSIPPRSNPQSKEEYSKEEDNRENESSGVAPPNENLENGVSVVPQMLKVFCEINKVYHKEQDRDFPELLKIAQTLTGSKTPTIEIIPKWKGLVEFIVSNDFYKSFSIKQINNNIQAILLKKENNGSDQRNNQQGSTAKHLISTGRFGKL